jgi:tetratricopeptide (TPR) repeat protein
MLYWIGRSAAAQQGGLERAQQSLESAASLFLQSDQVARAADAYVLLGDYSMTAGQKAAAADYYQQALQLRKDVETQRRAARAQLQLARDSKESCNWDDAKEHLRQARVLAQQAGDTQLESEIQQEEEDWPSWFGRRVCEVADAATDGSDSAAAVAQQGLDAVLAFLGFAPASDSH